MEEPRMTSTMREKEREEGNWAPWLVSSKWSIQRGTLIPYSRKYWRELNLAVEPKIAIGRMI